MGHRIVMRSVWMTQVGWRTVCRKSYFVKVGRLANDAVVGPAGYVASEMIAT